MSRLQLIKRVKTQYILAGTSLGVLIYILQVSEPLFMEFKEFSMEFLYFYLEVVVVIMLVKVAFPDFIKRNADLFVNLSAKLYEKLSYKKEPQKPLVTVENTVYTKVRQNKYGSAESYVITNARKLINANPNWRVSNIVNMRSKFLHSEIKTALVKAGLAEKDWPPASTLVSWIRPYVKNKKSGKYS